MNDYISVYEYKIDKYGNSNIVLTDGVKILDNNCLMCEYGRNIEVIETVNGGSTYLTEFFSSIWTLGEKVGGVLGIIIKIVKWIIIIITAPLWLPLLLIEKISSFIFGRASSIKIVFIFMAVILNIFLIGAFLSGLLPLIANLFACVFINIANWIAVHMQGSFWMKCLYWLIKIIEIIVRVGIVYFFVKGLTAFAVIPFMYRRSQSWCNALYHSRKAGETVAKIYFIIFAIFNIPDLISNAIELLINDGTIVNVARKAKLSIDQVKYRWIPYLNIIFAMIDAIAIGINNANNIFMDKLDGALDDEELLKERFDETFQLYEPILVPFIGRENFNSIKCGLGTGVGCQESGRFIKFIMKIMKIIITLIKRTEDTAFMCVGSIWEVVNTVKSGILSGTLASIAYIVIVLLSFFLSSMWGMNMTN